MRNSKTWLWIILIVIILAISWFIYRNYFIPKIPEDITIDTNKILSLDNKKEKTHLSKVADTKGVYWMRGFDILWNEIEPKKGEINWDSTDEKIKEMNEGEIYLLPIVQPFANWDQETCHSEEKYFTEDNPKRGGRLGVGKPCDMNAYEEFLQKATERYDGDGKDDMPGLKIPIKY